jgi:START domain
MKRILLFTLFLFSQLISRAAINWELKKDKEGIKIYTGNIPNSNIKAIKAEFELNTSLSRLVAVLQDAKSHEQWVYKAKASYLVKKISDQEQVYYSEWSMPWPMANRDVVVHIKMNQDPVTKVLAISALAVPGYIPVNKHIIRILTSKASWTATPVGNDRVKIEYIAQADPGGSIPAWIVNMFCDKGPYETFKKLNEILGSDVYKNAHVDFIKN